MVLERTPKNTQTASHEPQWPQHRPEENHPRRWIFIFRNMVKTIDVNEQLHAALRTSENPQGTQMLLEEEYNRRLTAKQEGFSLIGSMNAPLQEGAAGTTSTPVHGGVAKATSTPVHGGGGGTHGGNGSGVNLPPKQLYNSDEEDDAEITDIRERHEEFEATMSKGAVGQKEGNQNEELWNEKAEQTKADCENRWHEYRRRTQLHLSAPARRFLKLQKQCITEFDLNNAELISVRMAKFLADELIDAYKQMEEQRNYCLEALTEEDLRNNPTYEEYMVKKRNLLDDALRRKDQYVARKEQLTSKSVSNEEAGNTPERPPPGMANGNQPKGDSPQQPGQSDYRQPGFPSSMNAITPIPKGPGQAAFQVYQEPQQTIPIKHRDPFTYQGQNLVQNTQQQQTQTRFKLDEELNLVGNWDDNNPRDYLAFKAQWKNFETKMFKSGRTSMDLYNALLKKVGSKAKALIKNNYITDMNSDSVYKEAIDNLEKQFYQPSYLLRELMTTLSKTNKMDDSYESLFGGYTKLQEVWRDLNHAELDNEQLKGLLFIATTEKSLSTGTWNHWLEVQNRAFSSENPMECFNVRLYMDAISTAMKNAQKKQNACGNPSRNNDSKTRPKPKPRTTLYGAYAGTLGTYNATTNSTSTDQNSPTTSTQDQARTKDGKCVFCKKTPHKYQLYCPKVMKGMTPNVIWKIAQENKIKCQMCLGTEHTTDNCEAFDRGVLKKCSMKKENGEQCNEKHCRFLHGVSTPPQNKKSNQ